MAWWKGDDVCVFLSLGSLFLGLFDGWEVFVFVGFACHKGYFFTVSFDSGGCLGRAVWTGLRLATAMQLVTTAHHMGCLLQGLISDDYLSR